MTDCTIVIAGSAGEGIQTIGDVLADALSAHGYAVFTWQEYESRIRGGQNTYTIRVREDPCNAPTWEADILLCLNKGAYEKSSDRLKDGGILLAEEPYGEGALVIPFKAMAKEELGRVIYANTIAAGALAGVLGMERDALEKVLDREFAAKGPDVAEANRKAARLGYDAAGAACREACPWSFPRRGGSHYLVAGNEALPMGAVRAGCRFIAAYPMTPSTGVITFLAKRSEELGIFCEQAEDEIAAVNMALGASFAGARAMTTTSGGGFALMVEGISLSGMTEVPVVIVLAQRPGPATGLPTRTAQGDLLFAVHAGHGEFPKAVLAPADPKDAFHKMVRAFNLADRFQIPVIVMSDQFLADSRFTVPDFQVDASRPESFLADPKDFSAYKRYALTGRRLAPPRPRREPPPGDRRQRRARPVGAHHGGPGRNGPRHGGKKASQGGASAPGHGASRSLPHGGRPGDLLFLGIVPGRGPGSRGPAPGRRRARGHAPLDRTVASCRRDLPGGGPALGGGKQRHGPAGFPPSHGPGSDHGPTDPSQRRAAPHRPIHQEGLP